MVIRSTIVDQFMLVLTRPGVDKSIAIAAVLPFAYSLYEQAIGDGAFSIPRVTFIAELSIIVLTMLFRTPPVRVTPNPLFWALTFVATYWGFLVATLYQAGRPLAPTWVTGGFSILSFGLMIWARVSLGRNIGFVPAERKIVTYGAYAYVRHPIYSALFITLFALNLSDFTWRNVVLDTISMSLFMVKSVVEESFLKQNADYARYMERVRWRWFPWIA
jgi:protein-S-isoprenylcysteine O-methyltransferase Ste14